MAAYLTLSFALIISLGAQRSLAQGLNDPTRPPPEVLGGSADGYEPAEGSSPAQVVIISKDRHQVTINGGRSTSASATGTPRGEDQRRGDRLAATRGD